MGLEPKPWTWGERLAFGALFTFACVCAAVVLVFAVALVYTLLPWSALFLAVSALAAHFAPTLAKRFPLL